MGEIGGAVEGVDNPPILRISLTAAVYLTALFSQDGMIGEPGVNRFDDHFFSFSVSLCN